MHKFNKELLQQNKWLFLLWLLRYREEDNNLYGPLTGHYKYIIIDCMDFNANNKSKYNYIKSQWMSKKSWIKYDLWDRAKKKTSIKCEMMKVGKNYIIKYVWHIITQNRSIRCKMSVS